MDLFVGLMSGTSADGIDAAIVDFSDRKPNLIGTFFSPHHEHLQNKIFALCHSGENEIQALGELDILLGKAFAQATKKLLKKYSIEPQQIKAIGSHGQTIRHSPKGKNPFTLQIADPNTIALLTGITTIADFRRKDMACGGQGAPLVPAFHQFVFSKKKRTRAIVNIGGMANVTLMLKNKKTIIGFDTGPGNILLDRWIQQHQKTKHDKNGAWASEGKLHENLLLKFLSDPYFSEPPPKSTGREKFNLAWIEDNLRTMDESISEANVQNTLVELTARSILHGIKKYLTTGEILICGGGARNLFLMKRLKKLAYPEFTIDKTDKYGIASDWVEAMAFAWLARQTLLQKTGNIPGVTGAKKAVILGGIYHPL